ncbi:MAG: hypothetical protein NC115_07620, partial [Bacteroidales bacterium]|nr:hypothetical protein [Bacteroidales bacterium]
EQKLNYEKDMINELDRQYAISENYRKGRQEGLAEGEAKGRKEGRKERILEMAKTMKARGMSITDIADITGLHISEIEVL